MGVRIDEQRKNPVKDWPASTTIFDLRGFIGLLQFFRRLVRDFTQIATLLTNLTRKSSSMQQWDEECDLAFNELKSRLVHSPIMMPPNLSLPFRRHIDASRYDVGGTPTHEDENRHDRAIAYFSKRLSSAEETYSANDRDLLGLIFF